MPPSPKPPANRDALEAVLTADELELIAEACAGFDMPFALWVNCDGIARFWEMIAIGRLAEQIQATEGIAKDAALREAAARLGLSAETIVSRRKRWRKAAYTKVQNAPRQERGIRLA